VREETLRLLKQVILFGSRATSSALKDSDLDIIVISEKFKGMFWLERIFEVLYALQSPIPCPIPLDVLCYTPEEAHARGQEISWVARAFRQGHIRFSE